jgi:hypothetical protein
MSQNMAAVAGPPSSPPRSTPKLDGSGRANTSLSYTRENPSIADPSNWRPSSKTISSSTGEMATDFMWPSTSQNHSRISRMPRSSTVRRT